MKEHKHNNTNGQKSTKTELISFSGQNGQHSIKIYFILYFTVIVQCANLNPCLIEL